MKIYLLNAPFMDNFVRCGRWQGVAARGGTMYYPIWLSYATGVLEKAGHKVRLVDAIARKWNIDNVKDDAKLFSPDLIVVDTNFSCLRNDIDTANQLKDTVDAQTVMVGPPVSQFAERILRDGVDIAARFEFDFTLRDIAESMDRGETLKDIKGVSYKENGSIVHNEDREIISSSELDEIPFVSKIYNEHLNVKDYFLNHALYPMVQIFTGRGCPNLCTFCSWPETLMGRKYRTRSIKDVVDEFEYIENSLSIKEIFIEDDAFTLSNKRIVQFCNELKERHIDIIWSCQSRATLDYETMKEMKNVGCRLLDVGYESGSNEILKNIKKGVTVEQLREFTKNAKRANLKILADFVIGFPGETIETAEQTISLTKELKPDLLQVAVATPMPGTKFYKFCLNNNFLLSDDLENSLDERGFQKCIVSYPQFNNEKIEYYVNKSLKEYYLTYNYVPIALKNVIGENGLYELKVLLKSAIGFISYMRHNK
jgi:anaerobic magnesium-protoporphyrin IX monomethyl ester cyclase